MGTTQTQDLEVRRSTDLEQLGELERILTDDSYDVPEVVDDPEQISREIVMQLLAAETDAELESFGAATGWREYAVPYSNQQEGTPFEIRGFNWRPSSYDEGQRVFFVVRAVNLTTGQSEVLTTGSGNVLAQLVNLARRGRLPGAVRMLVEADKPTKRGFKPLWLVTPGGPADDQEAAAA